MDPIGFGFEHYDGIGQYRTTDQNLPVDSSGSVLLDGADPDVRRRRRARRSCSPASPKAQACFAKQVDALRAQPLGHGGRRRVHPGRDQARSRPSLDIRALIDRRGHVAHVPLPFARGPGRCCRDHHDLEGEAKYSRRAILKRLGIGAGFLPLLSTERARAASASGFPTRFIAITWTDGICPPNFYPTGRGGTASRRPCRRTFSRSRPGAQAAPVLRSASKQQSPIDIKVMMDRRRELRRSFAYPAMLTGGVTAERHGRGPDDQRESPSIDQIYRRQPARDPGRRTTPSSTSAAGPTRATPAIARAGRRTPSRTIPTSCSTACSAGATMPRHASGRAARAAQERARLRRRRADELLQEPRHGRPGQGPGPPRLDPFAREAADAARRPRRRHCTTPTITPTGLNFNTVANYPESREVHGGHRWRPRSSAANLAR